MSESHMCLTVDGIYHNNLVEYKTMGHCLISVILYLMKYSMKKLKLREVKIFVQDHRTGK